MFGLIPRITLTFFEPILNSTSTTAELPLTEFINWALLIFLNGLPNKEKQSASREHEDQKRDDARMKILAARRAGAGGI